MDIEEALEHFRKNGAGTLATVRPDGSPHLSVVFAAVVDGALWISTREPACCSPASTITMCSSIERCTACAAAECIVDATALLAGSTLSIRY